MRKKRNQRNSLSAHSQLLYCCTAHRLSSMPHFNFTFFFLFSAFPTFSTQQIAFPYRMLLESRNARSFNLVLVKFIGCIQFISEWNKSVAESWTILQTIPRGVHQVRLKSWTDGQLHWLCKTVSGYAPLKAFFINIYRPTIQILSFFWPSILLLYIPSCQIYPFLCGGRVDRSTSNFTHRQSAIVYTLHLRSESSKGNKATA